MAREQYDDGMFSGSGGDDAADMPDDAAEESSELPPDFKAHCQVVFDDQASYDDRCQALFDAVEACLNAGGGGDHKGVDLIIGVGKGKPR